MKMSSSRLQRWLNGSFVCSKCGRKFSITSFGFGKAICPNCYKGEEKFLFYNKKYWLNRLLDRTMLKSKREEPDVNT